MIVNKDIPGPGSYQTVQMSGDGKYHESRYHNIRSISFDKQVKKSKSVHSVQQQVGPGKRSEG